MSPDWVELREAGLFARTLCVTREDVAFWKHLFESFEDVGIIRTVETRGREVVIAIVVPPDFVAEADAIIEDVVARRGCSFASPPLPASCREDWFLEEWAGGADEGEGWPVPAESQDAESSLSGSRRVEKT